MHEISLAEFQEKKREREREFLLESDRVQHYCVKFISNYRSIFILILV